MLWKSEKTVRVRNSIQGWLRFVRSCPRPKSEPLNSPMPGHGYKSLLNLLSENLWFPDGFQAV